MKLRLLFLVVFLALGAEPAVKIPAEVKAKPGRLTLIEATTDSKVVRWKCSSEDADCIAIRDDGRKAIFASPTPGRYIVLAWTAAGDVPSEAAQCVVVVGDAPPPVPPGPVPPGPGPGPTPGGAFNRALILYESAEEGKMPRAQDAILYDASVRAALKAKTLTDKDNPGGAFRIWDQNTDASADGKPWQDLMARPRASVPWVVLANDAGVVFEGPLPADVPAFLALLAKYGPKSQQRKAG